MKGQKLPTEKSSHPSGSDHMSKVKGLAGKPLHDAKTKVPGDKKFTR